MTLHPLTRFLFSTYPREVGNPHRQPPIYNDQQLKRFIDQNSGARPCFITVYRFMSIMSEIDKLFFDFDGDCLEEFIMFYETMTSHKYPAIPIITGKKGFHLYIILKSKTYLFPQCKGLLQNAAFFMLRMTYDKIPSSVDTSVIGDTRRFTRLPETLREDSKNYCSYLPSYFNELSPNEIYNYAKKLSTPRVEVRGIQRTLDEFPLMAELSKGVSDETPNGELRIEPGSECIFLKNVLRPCLYRHLTQYEEPLHKARVAATVDLLQFFSPSTILDLYSRLGWRDFDYETTAYQINKCKTYHPYSCKKLREPPTVPRRCCID